MEVREGIGKGRKWEIIPTFLLYEQTLTHTKRFLLVFCNRNHIKNNSGLALFTHNVMCMLL